MADDIDMSTEFVATYTQELAFVRYCRTSPDGHRTSFEFGTISNFEACCQATDHGEFFTPVGTPLPCDPTFTRAGLESMVASGRATFGEFPVTVAVGSGEMFRFTQEEF